MYERAFSVCNNTFKTSNPPFLNSWIIKNKNGLKADEWALLIIESKWHLGTEAPFDHPADENASGDPDDLRNTDFASELAQ